MSSDTKPLVGEMAVRYGIRLDASDSALAIISFSQIVLEQAIEEVCEQMRSRIAEFETSAHKLETRHGHVDVRWHEIALLDIDDRRSGDFAIQGAGDAFPVTACSGHVNNR